MQRRVWDICCELGCSLLLDPTPNTSPKPDLQKVLPYRHPCHTRDVSWDSMWNGKSPLPCSQWLARTDLKRTNKIFDSNYVHVMRISHFLILVESRYLKWLCCFQCHSDLYTTQKPSYLGIITLCSLQLRIALIQTITPVYNDSHLKGTLRYPPKIEIRLIINFSHQQKDSFTP